MNISHRSIWNAALGAWVAVSEITRACGKRSVGAVTLALACSSVGAQAVSIDGGASATVPGTYTSPWAITGTLTVGDIGQGTVTVGGGATVSNNNGVLGQSAGAIGNATVTGAGTTWTSSFSFFAGYNGTGTLKVQDGGKVSNGNGHLGLNAGGVGNATVTGVDSTWSNSGTLDVGLSGTGTLTVEDGGKVSNTAGTIGNASGSTGHATVTGAGSTWTNVDFYVGNRGTGTLTVQDGGKVSNTFGSISYIAGSTGNATVTGAGSTWTNSGFLEIGSGGTGTLTVQDGGTVSSAVGYLGVVGNATGHATVTGANSTWTNSGALDVGGSGTGTLTVQDGGKVSNTAGTIANALGSTGNATVTGAGATWTNSGTLGVGRVGTGTLTVQDRGTVSNTEGFIGGNTGSVGNATVTGAGSTWTNSGQLLVGRSGTGTLTVQDGGTVSNTLAFIGTNLGSTGNATVTGTGTTWTIVGQLLVGNGGAGTLTVANGGHVSVSGAGVIDVALATGSTGVLNIGAAAAGAAQAAGTVAASELRFGAGTGSLNFKHTDTAYTFGTRIIGAGVLNHYAGTTLLTGANTYTGVTTINGGTLRVNGSIANSAVTVNSGGTLGGSGTVGSTTIASGGILAPGNSIGTLTVNGNLSFAAGSIYRVEVDAAGANDRINASGTATINGGTVDVLASAGTYAANTTYTILNATGGRTGNFAGVTSNLAFLTPTLGYDANNVFLSLARNSVSFASVAATPNQIATSTALQNADAGATGDMSSVQTALTGLSAGQARAAYDSASGVGLVALRSAGASFAGGFGNQLQARLAAVGGASTPVGAFAGGPILLAANDRVSDLMAPVSDSPQKFSLAGAASSPAFSASSRGRGFWLRGSGGYQDTKSDGNATASELRNNSLSAGFDAEVREGLVIGAALSSGTSRLGFDNNDAGKSRGSALAVYGSYAAGPWTFKGSASAARNSNHMDRSVVVGAIQRTASSDFGSSTLSAYGEATYSLSMNGWTLQPLAALSLSRNKADGFTETGAGALSLQVAGQTITSTKSLLGVKAGFAAGSVHLEPRVIWAHEFGDLNMPMTAQFQGAAAASPFQVSGVALKRDTLILGLGATGHIGKGLDLFADVQAEHNSRQNKLAVLVGLRARW